MNPTLEQVLSFCNTANSVQRAAILSALGANPNSPYMTPDPRRAQAAETLSKVSVGHPVSFPYGGASYTAEVLRINEKSAFVKLTEIIGKSKFMVGQEIRVPAGILARNLA